MFPRKPSNVLLNGRPVDPFSQISRVSTESTSSKPRSEAPASIIPLRPPTETAQLSATDSNVIIGLGTEIRGDISNCMRVDLHGHVHGSIMAAEIHIHINGSVDGSVVAARGHIFGSVKGDVAIRDHLQVCSTATIEGNVFYNQMSVEHGAQVSGTVKREDPVWFDSNFETLSARASIPMDRKAAAVPGPGET